MLLVLISNASYNDIKIPKSEQCFHLVCVLESNLCTVTSVFFLHVWTVSCCVCVAFHEQEEEEDRIAKYTHCIVWELVGRIKKKITFYSFLFYFRLAHVLFGLLMWSVSYPKLKGKWTKIEAAWQ